MKAILLLLLIGSNALLAARGADFIYRLKLFKFKPFTCDSCLTFWCAFAPPLLPIWCVSGLTFYMRLALTGLAFAAGLISFFNHTKNIVK